MIKWKPTWEPNALESEIVGIYVDVCVQVHKFSWEKGFSLEHHPIYIYVCIYWGIQIKESLVIYI